MRQDAARAKDEKAAGTDGNARPTLLRHLVHSNMPESELHVNRIARETQLLISAGVHTTTRSLEYISYHIISNEQIRFDLQKELKPVMAGYPKVLPSLSQLEKLPYLSSLIKEGLR